MPQHEKLDVLTGGRAAHQQDQSEHLPEDQVQQPQRHSGIMSGRQSPLVIYASPTCDTPHQYSVGFQNRSRALKPLVIGGIRILEPDGVLVWGVTSQACIDDQR